MSATTSPKTTIAKHSTGWRVMRLVADRAAKGILESPAQWGGHRLMNHADKIRYINYQFEQLTAFYRLRGRRP